MIDRVTRQLPLADVGKAGNTGNLGVAGKCENPALDCSGKAKEAGKAREAEEAGFKALLKQRVCQPETQPASGGVQFSKHARQRAEERGIEVTGDLVEQLASSVEMAQEKGAKNILVVDAGRAFIINVPQGRVVTTIAQDEMKANIFTNIDGAVLLNK